MKSLLFLAGLFLILSNVVKAQSSFGGPQIKVIQNPTCNEANGQIQILDSSGNQITDLFRLFKMPDSTLIGSGSSFTGLSQGNYIVQHYFSDGSFSYTLFSLSNFKPLDEGKFLLAMNWGTFPDTCSQSKGNVRLGRTWRQEDRDTLNMVQWTWSNGQTGINVNGLKAKELYWVRGGFGPDCPYYIPHTNFLNSFANDTNEFNNQGPFRIIRINKDTLFFKISNDNTLDVGFTNIVQPLCQTKTGSITATVYNSGTPPFQWKWSNDSTKAKIQNVKWGFYSVRVTDASGCQGADSYYLSAINPPGFSASLSILKLDSCLFNQGAVEAHVTGGFRPYSYFWNYNNTGSTDSVFTSAAQGNIFLTVKDSLGCQQYTGLNLPGLNPMNVMTNIVNLDCLGSSGVFNVTASGGVGPYKIFWDGYPTEHQFFMDSLSPGRYNGFVADSNGCKIRFGSYLSIPSSCYRTLKLGVFKDENTDCEKQEPELPIRNNYVRYKVLNQYEFTSLHSEYFSIQVLPGIQDVRLQKKPHFTPACLDTNWQIPDLIINSNAPHTYKNVGLGALQIRKNTSVFMYLNNGAFRPGFTTGFQMVVENDGNQMLESGFLTLELPNDVTFEGSNQPHTVLAPNLVRFQYSGIALGSRSYFNVLLKLAETVPLSVTKSFEVRLDTLSGETVLDDNLQVFDFLTRGSYDPNDIVVHPSPYIKPSKTLLSYRIRFQNLGTYYAENVVVVDTLPENVDPSTLIMGTSSHRPSKIELKGRILTVRFFNIKLPDSASNEPGSHGEINFKISRLADLPIGTKIRNSASIYFDFNAPVKTNTSEVEVFDPAIHLGGSVFPYPNPGSTQFKLMGSDAVEVDVFDLSGKKIRHLYQNEKGAFSLSQISSGIYFLRFEHNGKPKTGKLMVSK